jgi:hypothetical protein
MPPALKTDFQTYHGCANDCKMLLANTLVLASVRRRIQAKQRL